MKSIAFAMLTLAVLGACAAPAQEQAPSSPDLSADGRTIAEAQCAGCHAVGEIGDSPAAGAPPFRMLLSRYRADVLEEELIAGIQVAHQMPDFHFNPQAADALIGYLQTIQVEEPASEP